jgi:crossover junction endodeoxyribonuclease RuvC
MKRDLRAQPPRTWVGLDLSLLRTGVAILTPDSLRTVVVSPPKKVFGAARLDYMVRAMEDAGAFSGHVTCMEGYSMGTRGGRTFDIGELGGLVKLTLLRSGKRFHIAPPSTLKKFVTGKGSGVDKVAVAVRLSTRFGHDMEDSDSADATGLAYMAAALDGALNDLLSYEQEALKGTTQGF